MQACAVCHRAHTDRLVRHTAHIQVHVAAVSGAPQRVFGFTSRARVGSGASRPPTRSSAMVGHVVLRVSPALALLGSAGLSAPGCYAEQASARHAPVFGRVVSGRAHVLVRRRVGMETTTAYVRCLCVVGAAAVRANLRCRPLVERCGARFGFTLAIVCCFSDSTGSLSVLLWYDRMKAHVVATTGAFRILGAAGQCMV